MLPVSIIVENPATLPVVTSSAGNEVWRHPLSWSALAYHVGFQVSHCHLIARKGLETRLSILRLHEQINYTNQKSKKNIQSA